MDVPDGLEDRVARALQRAGLSNRDAVLVAGVSGGADSSALVHSLHRLRSRHSLSLHVAHLNHDFRGPEADEDAEHVAGMARELGLNAVVEKWDPEEFRRDYPGRSGSSFEELAREMRYLFLARTAKSLGAAAVAVGHTADDQAETVMLHLLRGAGLHGIAGMSEASPWPWPSEGEGVLLFRPLLSVAKSDTAEYCRRLGIAWREDSGNLLSRFARVRVRRELLPHLELDYNPRVRDSLVRLAGTAAMDLDFLESEVQLRWPALSLELDGAIYLDIEEMAAMHPALQRLALRRAYQEVKGDARRLQERHLSRLALLATDGRSGNAIALPIGIKAERTYRHLVVFRGDSLPCPLPPVNGEHDIRLPEAPGGSANTAIPGWLVWVSHSTPGNRPSSAITGATTEAGETGGNGQGGRLPWRGESWSVGLSATSVAGGLKLRSRRPGDRWQPEGMAVEKKLQDFFVDAHTPRAWRDRVPLLVTGRGIAAVAGHRAAEWALGQGESGTSGPTLWISMELAD